MSNTRVQLPGDVPDLLRSPDDAPVLVAVSGGSDSVALVLVMFEARKGGAVPPLHLAHLNHGIRGEEARRDVDFVRDLARRLGLPLIAGETDVPATARDRCVSLEYAARECRYEFLAEAADDVGAHWVLLGHTADDQLETILHHLIRGTGIHGLAGMPRTRPLTPGSDVRILRPLIEHSRRDLVDMLDAIGQDYRTDHTNLDTTYTRNRIRHQLIPALEADWPDIRTDVTDFARVLGTLDGLLESRAHGWTRMHARRTRGVLEASLDEVNALDEPVASYVIRRLIAETLGDLRRIDKVHVTMVAEVAAAGSPGSSLDLPRGLTVRRGYDTISFEVGEPKVRPDASQARPRAVPEKPQPLTPVELAIPGETRWGRWTFYVSVLEGREIWRELEGLCGCRVFPELLSPPDDAAGRMRAFIRLLREIDPEAVEYLDCDRVGGGRLTVRRREPGDRFTPLGAPGQKKLKDFLIRRKVPRAERDAVPLIVADDLILVVVGLGVSDAARLTDNTRRVLKITATRQAP